MLYDFGTRNKTFLNMHKILKGLGRKNNKFFLILLNDKLKDVDPFDPNLSMDVMNDIKNECVHNIWYYLREVWRIEQEDGTISPFLLDIGSLAGIWLQAQGFNTYRESPRQTGKTVGDSAHLGYNFNFRSRKSSIGIYNYDDTKVKEDLQDIIKQLKLIPKYLRFFQTEVKTLENGGVTLKDASESGKHILSVTNAVLGNTIIAKTCGQTQESADKTGKGGTYPIQRWDEVGFVYHIDRAFGSGFPAQNTAAKFAARGGLPNYIAVTSTPPDASKPHGEYLYQYFKIDSLKFEPFMFDKTTEELTEMRNKNAKKDFFFISFQYYELGYDEEWAMKQRRKYDDYTFRRDILLQWIKNFIGSPFSKIDLEKIEMMTSEESYVAKEIMGYYILKVHSYLGMTPEDTLTYLYDEVVSIGIDVGTGAGGDRDSSTFVGSSVVTGETLFTLKTNEADSRVFSEIIYHLVTNYFPKALVIIERNAIGKAVVDNLKVTDIEENLYYTQMSLDQIKANIIAEKKGKYLYGIFNIEKIRTILYDVILRDVVSNKKRLIRSKDIYEEISTLVSLNNKITHKPGCHDDLVMAKMFSLYPLLYDTELDYNFGIDKPTFPNDDSGLLLSFEDYSNQFYNGRQPKKDRAEELTENLEKNLPVTLNDISELLSIDETMRQVDKQSYLEETSLSKRIGEKFRSSREEGVISHDYDAKDFDPYK